MTYGEKYAEYAHSAQDHIDNATKVVERGDLWTAHMLICRAIQDLQASADLIQEASKVAFDRVFKARAPSNV